MGKTKHKSYRYEDRDYVDGYGVDSRKKVNKQKTKRFEHALKCKDIEELCHIDDDGIDIDDEDIR